MVARQNIAICGPSTTVVKQNIAICGPATMVAKQNIAIFGLTTTVARKENGKVKTENGKLTYPLRRYAPRPPDSEGQSVTTEYPKLSP